MRAARMFLINALLGMSGTVLLASCAQPASPPDERAARLTGYFNDADSNGNGVVEAIEINAVTEKTFSSMDYNADSTVTIDDVYNEEQALFEDTEPIRDLSHHLPHDLDGNDAITLEEYRSYLDSEQFGKMDSSGDGQISLDEYRAFEAF